MEQYGTYGKQTMGFWWKNATCKWCWEHLHQNPRGVLVRSILTGNSSPESRVFTMSGKGAVDPSGVTPNSGPCDGHNGDVQNKPAADVVPRDLSQAHLDDSWPMPGVFFGTWCFVEGETT